MKNLMRGIEFSPISRYAKVSKSVCLSTNQVYNKISVTQKKRRKNRVY